MEAPSPFLGDTIMKHGTPFTTLTGPHAFIVSSFLLLTVAAPASAQPDRHERETEHFVEWFQAHGYTIEAIHDSGSFEGEGDALFQPGQALLWCGYGVRSSLQVYKDIAGLIEVEIALLRLVDERFYHLDTCFCPLDEDRVMYYPPAFDAYANTVIEDYAVEVG